MADDPTTTGPAPGPAAVGPRAGDRPGRAPLSARGLVLLGSVLVVATCGLVYELATAALASYLLGDSVTQFSLVIGVYLSAMGVGSWLSQHVREREAERFVQAQGVVAVFGGLSAPALMLGFSRLASLRPLLFVVLMVIGVMVGLEIPLLIRLLRRDHTLATLVARVLAVDYLGALIASIAFPLLLLPGLGLSRTTLAFGVLNGAVALACVWVCWGELRAPRRWLAGTMALTTSLAGAWLAAPRFERIAEEELYDAPIVIAARSRYQRLTVTRWGDDWRLYIDGNLQFSSVDEHRYHEVLVHPAAAQVPRIGRALVLGGGDGMALREVLRYPELTRVDLVDLDPEMTRLFAEDPQLARLNGGAYADPRVEVHVADALHWVQAAVDAGQPPWDLVIVDFPDPNNFALGKLYTREFYALLRRALAPEGALAVQATSPGLTPRAYWCVVRTLEAAGFSVAPMHVHVPAFGDWGFALATPTERPPPSRLRPGLELAFLDDLALSTVFVFGRDQRPVEVEINRLIDQKLVSYYEADLRPWSRVGPGR